MEPLSCFLKCRQSCSLISEVLSFPLDWFSHTTAVVGLCIFQVSVMSLWPAVYSSHSTLPFTLDHRFLICFIFYSSVVKFHKGAGQLSTQAKNTSFLGDQTLVPNGLMIQADSCILFAGFIHYRIQKGNYFSICGKSIINFYQWFTRHCVLLSRI